MEGLWIVVGQHLSLEFSQPPDLPLNQIQGVVAAAVQRVERRWYEGDAGRVVPDLGVQAGCVLLGRFPHQGPHGWIPRPRLI